MSPVDENETNGDASAGAGSTSSPLSSPNLALSTEGPAISRQLSPVDTSSSSPVPSSLPGDVSHLPPWTSIYPDAAPSYEAVMSTPNLRVYPDPPENVPLPSSPMLIPVSSSWDAYGVSSGSPPYSASPVLPNASPSSALCSHRISTSPAPPGSASPRPAVRVVTPNAPAPSRASPPSPGERADGADTPRRRFGFMSLFHSRSTSRLRARSHSHSHSSAPSAPGGRVASPELLAPVPTRPPFHRLSQSASGSMLNLVSRSRADN